jgi:hypothetical protein
MLNRYADGMVTLLSIEQLTSPNEAGPLPTVVAPSVSDAGQNGDGGSPTAAATKGGTAKATPAATEDAKKATPIATIGFNWSPSTDGMTPTFLPIAAGGKKKKATATPTPGTGGKSESPGATPTSTPGAANQAAGVNEATAKAVSHLVSIYQYKNLQETCLTLAASRYQAEFIVWYQNRLSGKPDIVFPPPPEDERIWVYCDTVFKVLAHGADTTAAHEPSPTGKATPPGHAAADGAKDASAARDDTTPPPTSIAPSHSVKPPKAARDGETTSLDGIRNVRDDLSDTGGY